MNLKTYMYTKLNFTDLKLWLNISAEIQDRFHIAIDKIWSENQQKK